MRTNTVPAPPREQRGILLTDHQLDEKSVVIIGDIHGCAQALRSLLTEIVNTNCQVVFVGDLIDRGENFKSVFTIVHSMCTMPEKWGIKSATCIMGNHERMILDAYAGLDFGLWMRNGGLIEDFQFLSDSGRWGWLNGLPLWYEHGKRVLWNGRELKLLVTHGSVQPGVPMDRQDEETLYWGRQIQGYSPDYLTINGHTICREGEPLEYETPTGTVLRIDTGSYFTGIVTGLALREVTD
jgi:serine/threonine protein phosphatase 1